MGSICIHGDNTHYFDWLWNDYDAEMYALVNGTAYRTYGQGSYWSGTTGDFYCYNGINMYAYDTSTFTPSSGNWVAMRVLQRGSKAPIEYDGYQNIKGRLYRLVWKTESEADNYSGQRVIIPALCKNASGGHLDARAFKVEDRNSYINIYKHIVQSGEYSDVQGKNYPWYLDAHKCVVNNVDNITNLTISADGCFPISTTNGNTIYAPKWNSDYYTPYLSYNNTGKRFIKIEIIHYNSSGTVISSNSGIAAPNYTSSISFPSQTDLGNDSDVIHINISYYTSSGSFNRIYMQNYNIVTYFNAPTKYITDSTYTCSSTTGSYTSYYRYSTTKTISNTYMYGTGFITTVKNTGIFGSSYPYKQIYKPYYNQSISYGDSVVIPASSNSGSSIMRAFNYGNGKGAYSIYPPVVLNSGSTYEGSKVLDTCVAVKNNCSSYITIKSSSFSIPKDDVFYAIPYVNSRYCYSEYVLTNNSSHKKICYYKITNSSTSFEHTVTVSANSSYTLDLDYLNEAWPGAEIVFYTKDVKIKTAENTLSDIKTMYIKTDSSTLSTVKAVYLKTDSGWKQVM